MFTWDFILIALCFQELILSFHCQVAPPRDTGLFLVHGSAVQSSLIIASHFTRLLVSYIYGYPQCLLLGCTPFYLFHFSS